LQRNKPMSGLVRGCGFAATVAYRQRMPPKAKHGNAGREARRLAKIGVA